MKNLKLSLTVFAMIFSLQLSLASGITPESKKFIIDNEAVSYTLEDEADATLFTEISYCEVKERLCFKSMLKIEFVQILDSENQIVYQLPVEIAKLHLALSTFDTGDYTINIKLEGKKDIVSSSVSRK